MRVPQKSTVAVSTIRTPLRHALALASFGAVGGALVVTGLFLSLGSGSDTEPAEPVIQAVVVDPIVPIQQSVPADSWPATVAEQVAPGIALITAVDDLGATTGSGVVFRPDGYLLTSADLVADAVAVTVGFADGTVSPGEVLGTDDVSGLAVVKVDGSDIVAARLGLVVAPPEVGDYAVTVSARADSELHMATISAIGVSVPVAENFGLHGLLQLEGGLPEAGSGAGVVDDTGSVIGIAVDVGTNNATYAVPVGYARKIAEDILDHGHANHSWMGIRGVDHEPDETGQPSVLPATPSVRVQSVITDSPADRAGLRKGTFIMAIDNQGVASMADLIQELRRHAPGDVVEVTVSVDGETYRKAVQLATRSVNDTT